MGIAKKFWGIFVFGMVCIPFAIWKWVDIVVFIVRRVSAALGGGE